MSKPIIVDDPGYNPDAERWWRDSPDMRWRTGPVVVIRTRLYDECLGGALEPPPDKP